jgi:hypothetical protein
VIPRARHCTASASLPAPLRQLRARRPAHYLQGRGKRYGRSRSVRRPRAASWKGRSSTVLGGGRFGRGETPRHRPDRECPSGRSRRCVASAPPGGGSEGYDVQESKLLAAQHVFRSRSQFRSTAPAVRQPFACQREEARSSRSRIGGGGGRSRRGFAYQQPRIWAAAQPSEPASQANATARATAPPACTGELPGPGAGGSANRRAITAVLRVTNRRFSQGGCCHAHDVGR